MWGQSEDKDWSWSVCCQTEKIFVTFLTSGRVFVPSIWGSVQCLDNREINLIIMAIIRKAWNGSCVVISFSHALAQLCINTIRLLMRELKFEEGKGLAENQAWGLDLESKTIGPRVWTQCLSYSNACSITLWHSAEMEEMHDRSAPSLPLLSLVVCSSHRRETWVVPSPLRTFLHTPHYMLCGTPLSSFMGQVGSWVFLQP